MKSNPTPPPHPALVPIDNFNPDKNDGTVTYYSLWVTTLPNVLRALGRGRQTFVTVGFTFGVDRNVGEVAVRAIFDGARSMPVSRKQAVAFIEDVTSNFKTRKPRIVLGVADCCLFVHPLRDLHIDAIR